DFLGSHGFVEQCDVVDAPVPISRPTPFRRERSAVIVWLDSDAKPSGSSRSERTAIRGSSGDFAINVETVLAGRRIEYESRMDPLPFRKVDVVDSLSSIADDGL